MSDIVIKIANITRILTGEVPVTLVEEADLEIRRGEFVVITGPSGSGKSSLLYLLGLLDTPTRGTIWMNGENVSTYSQDKLAELRLADVGFVFQFHFLLPEFSALENVMLPMQRLGRLSDTQIRTRATSLLTDLGIEEQQDKLPNQLSGGQSQRVAIARAMANNPQLILADEPTGNLDSASSENVENILKDLARRYNRAVAVVTHETRIAAAADRVVTIIDGRING